MFEKIIRDYFSFSRKERTAVMVLTILIVVIFLLPYLVPKQDLPLTGEDLKIVRHQAESFRPSDRNEYNGNSDSVGAGLPVYGVSKHEKVYSEASTELFKFDPNNLSTQDWKRLGLPDRTIATIHNYTSKGGRFRRKEDLEKIYGLSSNDAVRLMPYVTIPDSKEPVSQTRSVHPADLLFEKPNYLPKSRIERQPVDINDADTASLIALPGIGSKLASRIVYFRNKLGGFNSVDQVSEVYGLQDSVFQRIKPLLQLSSQHVLQININTVEVDELKQHPYIRWNLATAIVAYRKQHGNYKAIAELKNIAPMTEVLFIKIAPYVKIEE